MSNVKPFIDFETERLHIRSVIEADKNEYMALRVNNSNISKAYSIMPDFTDYEWDGELNGEEDIHLSVFLKLDGIFVASASVQNYQEETVEIGYDVKEESRNAGIATEIVKGLLAEVHRLFPKSKVIIRADYENDASKRVAEKCGGVLIRREDSLACRMFSITKNALEAEGKDFEQSEQYADMRALMEKGKDAVCVYELP